MALIDSKSNYIICDKCGSKEFVEKQVFTLREEPLRTGIKTIREKSNKQFFCAKCNFNVNDLIKYEIIE